ncbi:MAG: hypothetical protein A4E30_00604 [Methanomassiliicoccales archaeon PtaB.Bin215]|nr:MAG: hypothetical protein A4E30_00604 [Methanomassiliicoccales archaeon PtaB.Bin215]
MFSSTIMAEPSKLAWATIRMSLLAVFTFRCFMMAADATRYPMSMVSVSKAVMTAPLLP